MALKLQMNVEKSQIIFIEYSYNNKNKTNTKQNIITSIANE